jgi:drug/metabolite transporter (DMT)-like permease
MTWWSFFLILVSLIAFVAGQLLMKHAMESSGSEGFRDARVIINLVSGISCMTVSFFLTLGLLGHFDLSYLYPFQGLSVIFICIAAAIVLRERLTLQLIIGSLLISAGVVLVSLT